MVSATTSIEMLFENYLFNGLWEAPTGNGKLLGALRGSGTNSTTRLLRLAERLGKCHNFLHLAQTRLNCQYLTQLAQYDLTSLSLSLFLALSAEITDFDFSEFVQELIVVRSGRGDMTRAPIPVPIAHSSGFQNVTYRSPEVILFYIYKGNYVCCLKEILHELKFCQIQLFSQIINRIEICFSHVSALRVVSF